MFTVADPHPMLGVPYLERRLPRLLLFGSFGVVVVPLLALTQWNSDAPLTQHALYLHGIGLGLTHFLITFAVYGQSGHRDHFRASRAGRMFYLYLPPLVLGSFALLAFVDVRARAPVLSGVLFGAVRMLDFHHVGRQSFGVLQLLRGTTAPEADALRRAERRFFDLLAASQWITFARGGRADAREVWCALMLLLLLGSFVTLLARELTQPVRRPRVVGYLVLQAASGAWAVYDTRLYLVGLALHYVEYHVLMFPRCMRTRLDATRWTDRWFAALRRVPLLFYGLLLATAQLLDLLSGQLARTATFSTSLVHVFDGLFVAHYLVEARLWRLREPFYREQVGPLYLAPRSLVPSPPEGAPLTGSA